MATGSSEHKSDTAHEAPPVTTTAKPKAVDGPGKTELTQMLASGSPSPAAVAGVFAKYPAEHAEMAMLVQQTPALGNGFMEKVMALVPSEDAAGGAEGGTPAAGGGAAAPVPAGPGLAELATLAVSSPDGPKIDQVIALLDQYPGEHDQMLGAIGTYFGQGYIDELQQRMPHLRIHWKELQLVAGDPNSETGNFLVAGKEMGGGKVRTGLLGGTFNGEFGGDKKYDVSQRWKSGNFITASDANGAAWQLSKFTGTYVKGTGLDAQYAFTDAKALKAHYDAKSGFGTMGYYRSGQLVGPLLSANYKSGKDYQLKLEQGLKFGEGTTGSLTATHGVTPGADPATTMRDNLEFGLTSKDHKVDANAGLRPDGSAAAGLSSSHKFGDATSLTTKGSLDHGKAEFGVHGEHQWNPKTLTTLDGKVDNKGYGLGTTTSYKDGGFGLSSTSAINGKYGEKPVLTSGLAQTYESGKLKEKASIDATSGADGQPAGIKAQAEATYKASDTLQAKVHAEAEKKAGSEATASLGAEVLFTPTRRSKFEAKGLIDAEGKLQAGVTYTLLAKEAAAAEGLDAKAAETLLTVGVSLDKDGSVTAAGHLKLKDSKADASATLSPDGYKLAASAETGIDPKSDFYAKVSGDLASKDGSETTGQLAAEMRLSTSDVTELKASGLIKVDGSYNLNMSFEQFKSTLDKSGVAADKKETLYKVALQLKNDGKFIVSGEAHLDLGKDTDFNFKGQVSESGYSATSDLTRKLGTNGQAQLTSDFDQDGMKFGASTTYKKDGFSLDGAASYQSGYDKPSQFQGSLTQSYKTPTFNQRASLSYGQTDGFKMSAGFDKQLADKWYAGADAKMSMGGGKDFAGDFAAYIAFYPTAKNRLFLAGHINETGVPSARLGLDVLENAFKGENGAGLATAKSILSVWIGIGDQGHFNDQFGTQSKIPPAWGLGGGSGKFTPSVGLTFKF